MKSSKVVSALDVAKYFIDLASKIDENDLTNLKLQKLIYFAQGKYLSKHKSPLFIEQIEAWNFGPVVKSVYETFKSCGAFPITTFDVKFDSKELPPEIKNFLKEVWDEYSKFSAFYLVNKTHAINGPWYNCYHSPDQKIIDKDDLQKYFESH